MGQCASKPNEEKSCEVGVGGSSTFGSEQAEEEEEEMSPEELKSRRQMVERRKDSLQGDKIIVGPLSKKHSLNRTRSKKASVTKIDRKDSKNGHIKSSLGHPDNSYKYVDPNAEFLVHDVVKRGICETFVIDFEPRKKPPPKLSGPKSLTPSSSPSTLSTPFSSPSATVKSKNKLNAELGGNKKVQKELSNKAIKSIVASTTTTTAAAAKESKSKVKTSPVIPVRKQQNPKKKNSKLKKDEGRIHSAVVSGINMDSRSVTVEWFERGETKGKEIELDAILSLNNDLAPQNDNSNGIPNKLSKYVPRPSVAVPPQQQQQPQQPNNRSANSGSSAVVVSAGNMRTRNNKGRPTMNGAEMIIQQQQQQPAKQQQQLMPPPPPPQISKQLQQEQDDEPSQNGSDSGTGKGGARGRRSNVVKEVERLKKNREERRAKQQEILEEKVALKNVDPGNPNWEFLSMIREYQEQVEFNPLQDGDAAYIDHQITVCVRKRPLNKKEKLRKEVDVVTVPNKDQTIVHEPKTKVDLTKYLDNQHFRFDYAFDDNCSNELVYKYTARPLVQNIFEGGMATCFAYGQTGSGKTHTMGGEFHGKTQDSKNGIYALATKDVFKLLHAPKYKTLKLSVSCSYFEIYSGKVFDLLSAKAKLRVLEDGKQQVVIVGLMEKTVESVEDVLKLINLGNNVRTSGQTSANAHSSRSHAVFQIILRNGAKKSLYGKFSLIDLAGNERGADTSSANRQTRMEGAEINKSLLALKECIRALGRKGAHLPFRASKLTQVLRDSFIGEKSKTCMIAMISPGLSSCEHSLNTLRYADRVKELGAEDPALQKASPTENGLLLDEDSMRSEDGVLSPEDSDLAQLRSLNDTELSADWYNFQEAVTHLQELEEDLVDSHRSLIVNMQQWASDDAALLAMTNEVDYDQDAYCHALEEMINEKIEAFVSLRERARNFRDSQIDEEAKSRLLTRRN